jgi:hypothetical protein
MNPNTHELRGRATACKIMDMAKHRRSGTMTELLREALLAATSLNAIQKATGVRRQTLAAFMRGEQRSIHLASADKLAQYFGIVCSQEQTPQRKEGL